MKTYWVYMMQNANGRALYTGVTNNLDSRNNNKNFNLRVFYKI